MAFDVLVNLASDVPAAAAQAARILEIIDAETDAAAAPGASASASTASGASRPRRTPRGR